MRFKNLLVAFFHTVAASKETIRALESQPLVKPTSRCTEYCEFVAQNHEQRMAFFDGAAVTPKILKEAHGNFKLKCSMSVCHVRADGSFVNGDSLMTPHSEYYTTFDVASRTPIFLENSFAHTLCTIFENTFKCLQCGQFAEIPCAKFHRFLHLNRSEKDAFFRYRGSLCLTRKDRMVILEYAFDALAQRNNQASFDLREVVWFFADSIEKQRVCFEEVFEKLLYKKVGINCEWRRRVFCALIEHHTGAVARLLDNFWLAESTFPQIQKKDFLENFVIPLTLSDPNKVSVCTMAITETTLQIFQSTYLLLLCWRLTEEANKFILQLFSKVLWARKTVERSLRGSCNAFLNGVLQCSPAPLTLILKSNYLATKPTEEEVFVLLSAAFEGRGASDSPSSLTNVLVRTSTLRLRNFVLDNVFRVDNAHSLCEQLLRRKALIKNDFFEHLKTSPSQQNPLVLQVLAEHFSLKPETIYLTARQNLVTSPYFQLIAENFKTCSHNVRVLLARDLLANNVKAYFALIFESLDFSNISAVSFFDVENLFILSKETKALLISKVSSTEAESLNLIQFMKSLKVQKGCLNLMHHNSHTYLDKQFLFLVNLLKPKIVKSFLSVYEAVIMQKLMPFPKKMNKSFDFESSVESAHSFDNSVHYDALD